MVNTRLVDLLTNDKTKLKNLNKYKKIYIPDKFLKGEYDTYLKSVSKIVLSTGCPNFNSLVNLILKVDDDSIPLIKILIDEMKLSDQQIKFLIKLHIYYFLKPLVKQEYFSSGLLEFEPLIHKSLRLSRIVNMEIIKKNLTDEQVKDFDNLVKIYKKRVDKITIAYEFVKAIKENNYKKTLTAFDKYKQTHPSNCERYFEFMFKKYKPKDEIIQKAKIVNGVLCLPKNFVYQMIAKEISLTFDVK